MLNENIRNLRKSKGLSQEELAIKERRDKCDAYYSKKMYVSNIPV